jgi:hypothetical protein
MPLLQTGPGMCKIAFLPLTPPTRQIEMPSRTLSLLLPDKLNLENVLAFARELDGIPSESNVSLAMGEERWFPPFSMLFLSAKIRAWKASNPSSRLILMDYKNHAYLGHMGFFRMCGAEFGKELGEADGSRNYVPITRVRREELYEGGADKFTELGDLIQRHADRIAAMISRDESGKTDMFNALSYSVREVFRNVFEHSDANEAFYCAQYWSASNKVEVSIADLGIGIRKGLGTNPNFRFGTDKEAIEASLLPGVSGKTHLPRRSETWFNSGYGLYMTNRLARHGGNFVIASGRKAIHLTRATKTNLDTSFPGTALRLNLDVEKIGNVRERLASFRKDAAKIAAEIKGAGNRPPSAMSLLLRRDFQ